MTTNTIADWFDAEYEEYIRMSTGDPYCPTHGQTPCLCYAWYQKQTYTGDNTYGNGTIGQPYKVEPLYPVADPFADWTYKQYSKTPTMRVKVVRHVEYIPHDRWTKLLMHCEEDWECLKGRIIETFRPETDYLYDNQEYNMGTIIWNDTKFTWNPTTTTTTNTITFSNDTDTGFVYDNSGSSYIYISNGTKTSTT